MFGRACGSSGVPNTEGRNSNNGLQRHKTELFYMIHSVGTEELTIRLQHKRTSVLLFCELFSLHLLHPRDDSYIFNMILYYLKIFSHLKKQV